MSRESWIRQTHRWVSMAFTLAVVRLEIVSFHVEPSS